VQLPRFRVRTLMLVVGVVAFLVWGVMMAARSYDYYRLARIYGTRERQWRYLAKRDRNRPRSIAARWGLQIADHYAPLAGKYRRAMWRPWTPVAPDPPAPVFGSP
jgi:hypothetical protein